MKHEIDKFLYGFITERIKGQHNLLLAVITDLKITFCIVSSLMY